MRRDANRRPKVPVLSQVVARGCGGKRCYADYATANRMATATRRDREGSRVQPYRCLHCHSWHVGENE